MSVIRFSALFYSFMLITLHSYLNRLNRDTSVPKVIQFFGAELFWIGSWVLWPQYNTILTLKNNTERHAEFFWPGGCDQNNCSPWRAEKWEDSVGNTTKKNLVIAVTLMTHISKHVFRRVWFCRLPKTRCRLSHRRWLHHWDPWHWNCGLKITTIPEWKIVF